MSCMDPPPQNSIQIHNLSRLLTQDNMLPNAVSQVHTHTHAPNTTNTILHGTTDCFAPAYKIHTHTHPHASWFDAECCAIARECHTKERHYRKPEALQKARSDINCLAFFAATCHRYNEFVVEKNKYWSEWTAEEHSSRGKLWQSLSKLL